MSRAPEGADRLAAIRERVRVAVDCRSDEPRPEYAVAYADDGAFLLGEIDAACDALDLADGGAGGTVASRICRLSHDRNILRRALVARYPDAPKMCSLDRMLLAAATIPALWTSVREGTSTFDAANDSPRLPLTERQRWAVENFLEQGPRVLLDLVADITAALDAAEAGADEDRGTSTERDPGASLAVRIHRLSEMRCRADWRVIAAHTALDHAGAADTTEDGTRLPLAARIEERLGRYSPKAGAEAEEFCQRIEAAQSECVPGSETFDLLQRILDRTNMRDSLRWLEEMDADKAEIARLRTRVAALEAAPSGVLS